MTHRATQSSCSSRLDRPKRLVFVLVDSLEPQAFAHQMERLIQDPLRWRHLALNGHLARRNHTWSNTMETFLEILRDCDLVKNGR